MLTREPADRRDLHQVLAWHQGMPDTLRLTLDHQPERDLTIVAAQHDPSHTAAIPTPRATSTLNRLLSHYPIPVTINGETLPRTDFDSTPSISLITTDPKILPGPRDHHMEMLSGVQQHVGTILFDGLFYYLAGLQDLDLAPRGEETQASLRVQQTIACSNPDWERTHHTPAERYDITYNMVRYASEHERDDSSFVEVLGTMYCVPSPASIRAMSDQLDAARQQVAQHAADTGRNLLSTHWGDLPRAWHPGYVDARLITSPLAVLVKPSPSMSRPIRWALAEALLDTDSDCLVPVSDSNRTPFWIEPVRIRIQTLQGERYDFPGHSDPLIELTKVLPAVRHPMPVASIKLDCQIRTDDQHCREVTVSLDLLPTGWIDLPFVMFTPSVVTDIDDTADRLARAYNPWRTHEDQFPATLHAAQPLAKRMIEGELQGFTAELQQLADSFQPAADPPPEPVTVTSADGRLSLRWFSGTSRTSDTDLPIS